VEIIDLGDGNTDLAIRHGSGKWSGLESEKLGDVLHVMHSNTRRTSKLSIFGHNLWFILLFLV
jgi:hypothetical protein